MSRGERGASMQGLEGGLRAASCDIAHKLASRLSGDALERLVAASPDLTHRLGGYPPDAAGLDTMDRDHLMDALARHLGADGWPCNGDPREVHDAFMARVKEAYRSGVLEAAPEDPAST